MVRNFSATAAGPGEVEDSAKWPKNPKDVVSNDMDTGALVSELANLNLLPGKIDLDLTHHEKKAAANNPETLIWALDEKEEPERIEEGTYRGTQLALAKVYDLIEQRYVHHSFCFAPRLLLIWLTAMCHLWIWLRSTL